MLVTNEVVEQTHEILRNPQLREAQELINYDLGREIFLHSGMARRKLAGRIAKLSRRSLVEFFLAKNRTREQSSSNSFDCLDPFATDSADGARVLILRNFVLKRRKRVRSGFRQVHLVGNDGRPPRRQP